MTQMSAKIRCDCDMDMCSDHNLIDILPFITFLFDRYSAGNVPNEQQVLNAITDWHRVYEA